jgi:hypothetical protein
VVSTNKWYYSHSPLIDDSIHRDSHYTLQYPNVCRSPVNRPSPMRVRIGNVYRRSVMTGSYPRTAVLQSLQWSLFFFRLRAGQPRGRSSSPCRVKNLLYSTSSTPVLGSNQPHIQRVPEVPCPGVKRPGRVADHSPPASAEVKKMWFYTSTPPYVFMA